MSEPAGMSWRSCFHCPSIVAVKWLSNGCAAELDLRRTKGLDGGASRRALQSLEADAVDRKALAHPCRVTHTGIT